MNCLAITSLIGRNAADFMQGYVTSDMDELSESSARPTAVTDIKGRVIANGWVYGGPEVVHLLIHESTVTRVHDHLAKYLIFSKAEFSESVERTDLVSAVTESPEVSPFGWHFTNELIDQPRFPSMLVEQGFGLVTSATSGQFLPQMIGITDFNAVSFSKGCYLGQEVVARAEHRGQVKRRLLRYSWSGSALNPGDSVVSSDNAKGIVIGCDGSRALVVLNDESPKLESQHASLELS